ncbi:RNA polymerase sigma factor [Paenibacillus sp. SYP-B4298]|uniref:RNA polymerase sigma factor n=1 Tax=Paenibacillus sp. SYP-B4298 TaxID=2996034 RepID=UPI0022DE2775|nr:sigma-70 region 4 domain-containing protein [Paenibacillus sp. SYP-B4298]
MSFEDIYSTTRIPPLNIAGDISVESVFECSLKKQMLQEAMLELKHEYRAVLLKYYMDGKSHKEISIELGTSTPVVAQRLARARKKLLSKFLLKWVDE